MQQGLAGHQHRLDVSLARRDPPLGEWPSAWCHGAVLRAGAGSPTSTGHPTEPTGQPDLDAAGLIFVGEMYGVQFDQLALVLKVTPRRAANVVTRWRRAGTAEAAVLSRGPRWVWLTRAGLAFCGLPYSPGVPGLSRLAHLRAVTAVRLALIGTPQFAAGGAYWRSERRLRARMAGRVGLREHVPDGEVHWADETGLPWAGECWAIEAELSRKTTVRTATIMRELLARTGDYGCLAADVQVPGTPARHDRVVYVCSQAAAPVVHRAKEALGRMGARVEIRLLPDASSLAGAPVTARAKLRP